MTSKYSDSLKVILLSTLQVVEEEQFNPSYHSQKKIDEEDAEISCKVGQG